MDFKTFSEILAAKNDFYFHPIVQIYVIFVLPFRSYQAQRVARLAGILNDTRDIIQNTLFHLIKFWGVLII